VRSKVTGVVEVPLLLSLYRLFNLGGHGGGRRCQSGAVSCQVHTVGVDIQAQ
jgi:hypothetical protein